MSLPAASVVAPVHDLPFVPDRVLVRRIEYALKTHGRYEPVASFRWWTVMVVERGHVRSLAMGEGLEAARSARLAAHDVVRYGFDAVQFDVTELGPRQLRRRW